MTSLHNQLFFSQFSHAFRAVPSHLNEYTTLQPNGVLLWLEFDLLSFHRWSFELVTYTVPFSLLPYSPIPLFPYSLLFFRPRALVYLAF